LQQVHAGLAGVQSLHGPVGTGAAAAGGGVAAPSAARQRNWARLSIALLDAAGLQPSSKAARVRCAGGKRAVFGGPFAEAKELVAGCTLIQVASRDEAPEWARCTPAPHGEAAEGEVGLCELNDFGPSEAVDRFRGLESSVKG
jgi:hypothetical protein